jgi:hypothetical protein
MKITVLPVRDPELPESRPRAHPSTAAPASGSGFEGIHSVSVELLRARRRRHVPSPTPKPAPVPVLAAQAAPGAPAALEIELPNGRIVRVPPGFASADLERVLAIASGDEAPQPPAPPNAPGARRPPDSR